MVKTARCGCSPGSGSIGATGPTGPGGDSNHDGVGANSTVVNISVGSPLAGGSRSIAIGHYAEVTAAEGIAIGADAYVTGEEAVAIGISALTTDDQSVAIGGSTKAQAFGATALGEQATASGSGAISIGRKSLASSSQSIAIGGNDDTSGFAGPWATAQGAIAIGASDALAVNGARASGASSIAIGSGDAASAGANASAADTISIGRSNVASAQYAIAIGPGASAGRISSICIGRNAYVDTAGTDQIAIGLGAHGGADQTIAIGDGANAIHARSCAIGYTAATTAVDQIMLGIAGQQVHFPGSLKIPTGAGASKVLTSDAAGVATWQDILGIQDQTFSYSGALISSTTSPPIRLRFNKTLTTLAVTLGTAGSTNTVLDILKNGVSVATVTVTSGATVHNETVSIAYTADTDKLALRVTTAGTGAADMTANARFT